MRTNSFRNASTGMPFTKLYRLPVIVLTSLTLYASRRLFLVVAASVPSTTTTSSPSGFSAALATSSIHSRSARIVPKIPQWSSHVSHQRPTTFRVLQSQVVHRHGDRTPITPMADTDYWASTLPSEHVLTLVAKGTTVVSQQTSQESSASMAVPTHPAGGQGPFGKLTQLGLLQMVGVGTALRDQFEWTRNSDNNDNIHDERGNVFINQGRIFHSTNNPLLPSHVKVFSTDFPRTILSVRGTLIGLFPDQVVDMEIDVRQTDKMIPDPQPRRTEEQEKLEAMLAKSQMLHHQEMELQPVAIHVTQALLPLLGKGAFGVSFGVGEEKNDTIIVDSNHQPSSLTLPQLAEVIKCLAVRGLLPSTITTDDQERIATFTASKWFHLLRHPRLAYLAMNPMVHAMVESMHAMIQNGSFPVILYSAHDSTLIGLLCALRLEQPAVWPEYGSTLTLELIEAVCNTSGETNHLVRFILNGNILKSQWNDDEEPYETIPLDRLTEYIKIDGLGEDNLSLL